MRGAERWIHAGADLPALGVPGRITVGVQDYLDQMDPLAEWWDKRVREYPDARTLTSALHADYHSAAREHAVARPLGLKSFAQRLTSRGFPVDADRTLGSLRCGLALRH
jgi:phage/plasmid-associated DNA primase